MFLVLQNVPLRINNKGYENTLKHCENVEMVKFEKDYSNCLERVSNKKSNIRW